MFFLNSLTQYFNSRGPDLFTDDQYKKFAQNFIKKRPNKSEMKNVGLHESDTKW